MWTQGLLSNFRRAAIDAQVVTALVAGQASRAVSAAASDTVRHIGHLASIKPQIEAIHQDTCKFWEEQVIPAASKHGSTVDNVREAIERSLLTVAGTLQNMFPPLDHAPGHEERKRAVQTTLEKTEVAIVDVLVKFGVDGDLVRKHYSEVKPRIESVIVAIGDLVEQHQATLTMVLLQVLTLILPGVWTRQLLPLAQMVIAGRAGGGPLLLWALNILFGFVPPKRISHS